MDSLTVSHRIDAPMEEVWEAFTDLSTMADRVRGITAVEVLEGDGEIAVGTRWRETRTMLGRQETEEMWVTEVVPHDRYVVEAESHGARYRSVFAFADADGATEVSLTFGAEPLTRTAKVMGMVTGPIARKAVMKTLVADLDDLAASLEA